MTKAGVVAAVVSKASKRKKPIKCDLDRTVGFDVVATSSSSVNSTNETGSYHFFATDKLWDSWLLKNYNLYPSGIWIKFAKVKSGIECMNWVESVRVALCHGWIDTTKKRLDDTYYVQRFTPRRPKSNWSVINKKHVEELIAAGLMQDSGLKEVEAAKKDGRWDKVNYSYEKAKASKK